MSFRTFKRSALNFEEFAKARKITVDAGLPREEARDACRAWNASRTPEEEQAGTKLEFEEE